jgi:hypothetical protein
MGWDHGVLESDTAASPGRQHSYFGSMEKIA